MKQMKRLAIFALVAALMHMVFTSTALAAAWSDAYIKTLRQAAGTRRMIALCELNGGGAPEMAVVSENASGGVSLKVYRWQTGRVVSSALSLNQVPLAGLSSASFQLRRGSLDKPCLLITLTASKAKTTATLKLGVTMTQTGVLTPVFAGGKRKTGKKTVNSLNGKQATAAQYTRAEKAFNGAYKAVGMLPSRMLTKTDKSAAIKTKFKALNKAHQPFSTIKTITLSKATVTLTTGHTLSLKAKTAPATAFTDKLTWSSANPAVASVGQNGLVTARTPGKAKITVASASGKRKSCTVTVKPILPSKITLSRSKLPLFKKDVVTLKATVTPAKAVYTLKWSSSDSKIVSVTQSGQLRALSGGSADITATTSNGKKATCRVTVSKKQPVIVDISSYNYSAQMDWKKIAANVDMLILRCGVTRTNTQPLGVGKDDYFAYYANKCRAYGIPFGVYYYGKCDDEATAKQEARKTYTLASPYKPLFYVYDVEESRISRKLAKTYITTLKGLGAKRTGFYVSHSLYTSFILDTSLVDFMWIPHYGKNDGTVTSTPAYPCDLHQYTSQGKIPGIPGVVDINRLTGSKPMSWFLGM